MIRQHNKILFAILFFFMFGSINSHALNNFTLDAEAPPKVVIISGKSVVLKIEEKVKRVSIGSPAIADYMLLSPTEIYITGKTAGLTNMILWKESGVSSIFDIEVKYDVSRLKEKLYQVLPDEKEIRVMATHDALTLTGRVSSAQNLSQAMTLAQSYAPKGKINNLMSVGGTHQVMLEVKIAEMTRSVGRDLGINLGNVSQIGDVAVQLLSNFTVGAGPTLGLSGVHDDVSWTAVLSALKSNGHVKVLAKPNLITLSGKSASFLAGGEYAIPVSSEDGITVEYKDYGVGLSFTPNVLNQEKINIQVETSVSEILSSATLSTELFVAPGLSTRRAATTVELADGQSFVIAGLLSDSVNESVKKFPFLGEIPILGLLFKSKSFQKNETELVIIVTPRLVKPINKETQSAPTDYYEEPGDSRFYLDTQPSAEISADDIPFDASMDGRFGHSFEQ